MIMPEMKSYLIYKISNKINGKVYIGQTAVTLKRRMDRHINNSYVPRCTIHWAIKKYGSKNFVCETICEGLSKQEANKKEMELIRQFSSKSPKFGYNMTDGGDGPNGNKQSEETKAKKSKKLKGHKPWITGLHHSEETKKKLSEAMKRRVLSEESKTRISAAVSAANSIRIASVETREKISASNKGHQAWNLGKSISEETRLKISIAGKGRKLTDEARKNIALGKIGNKYTLGHKASNETKNKIRNALKSYYEKFPRIISEATREKMRIAHTGRIPTAETRAKLSATKKGKIMSERVREINRAAWVIRKQRYQSQMSA